MTGTIPRRNPAQRCDWSETSVPADDYGCIITGMEMMRGGYVGMYVDIAEGPYEGVYNGIKEFPNRVPMSTKDYTMHSKRCGAISVSNPGFDAAAAWDAAEDIEALDAAFKGKRCRVVWRTKYRDPDDHKLYLEQNDDCTRVPETVTYSVLPWLPEETEAEAEPEPAPCAAAMVPAPKQEKRIQVDFRQRDAEHGGHHDAKHHALEAAGYQLVTETIETGDYVMSGSNYIVETKNSLQEISKNLSPASVDKFMDEMHRAQKDKQEMLVIIEEPGINGPSDVVKWMPKECRSCHACKPQDVEVCTLHKTGKPLCGYPLVAALEALANMEHVHVRFIGDPVRVAAAIAEWLQRGE